MASGLVSGTLGSMLVPRFSGWNLELGLHGCGLQGLGPQLQAPFPEWGSFSCLSCMSHFLQWASGWPLLLGQPISRSYVFFQGMASLTTPVTPSPLILCSGLGDNMNTGLFLQHLIPFPGPKRSWGEGQIIHLRLPACTTS